MGGSTIDPGVVESIEGTTAAEPLLALALFAAFIIAREAIKNRGIYVGQS